MRLRRLLFDELTVSRRSRDYAEPLPSHLLTMRDIDGMRELRAHRPKHQRRRRFALRLPWRWE